MKQWVQIRKTVSIAMTALLLFTAVPFTGTTAYAEPNGTPEGTLLIQENFEGTYPDNTPLDGASHANGTGTIAGFTSAMSGSTAANDTVALVTAEPVLGSTALKITQNSLSGSVTGVQRELDAAGFVKGQLTVEYDFALSNVTKNGNVLQVLDSGNKIVVDLQNKNKPDLSSGGSSSGKFIGFVNSDGNYTLLGPGQIENDIGYHIKAVLDLSGQKGSYYLTRKSDGSLVGQLLDHPLKSAASTSGVKSVLFATKGGNSGPWTMALDNILISHEDKLSAPGNVKAAAGDAKVDLSWDTVTGATYYSVKRSQNEGGGAPYSTIASQLSEAAYTDGAVVNGSTYYYVVTASNASGESANSAEASTVPVSANVKPAAPSQLAAIAGDAQIALSWSSVPGALSYQVKRSQAAEGPYEVIASSVTGTAFTDTGLTNGLPYYYVVSAVNAAGEGAHSIAVSGTPGNFLISDNFESNTLGALPSGYRPPLGSGVISAFTDANNTTVIANGSLTNSYGNTSAAIAGNDTQVLWINDGPSRGGFNKPFEPVTAASKQGITAKLSFMQPKKIGDSYVLELLDSNNKIAVSFNINASPVPIETNVWYTVTYVADAAANTADLYMKDGSSKEEQEVYIGNVAFSTPVTDIASINFRMAGSSTGSAYVDDILVFKQKTTVPQNLTGEGSDVKATLTWNAASGADSYHIYRKEAADGAEYKLVGQGITDTSYTDTSGLVNKKDYLYKVTAVNAFGESGYSNEAMVTPTDTKPPAGEVEGLKAVVRDGQLTIDWNPVEGAKFYTVERSTTPQGPFISLLYNGKPRIAGTAYLDMGLRSDTAYYYRVTPGNEGGLGKSKLLEKVSPAPALGAPVLLNAIAGSGKVELSWSSVKEAASYKVSRSTVNGGPYTVISGAGVTGTSFTDTGAENGAAYYYVVSAVTGLQESRISNQLKATPYEPVPGAPQQPAAVTAVADDSSVQLSWQPVQGAEGYNVLRSVTSGTNYEVVASTTDTFYADTGVHNGTTYYYSVAAVNGSGTGANSEETAVLPARVLTVDKEAVADGARIFNTVQSAVNTIPADNTERTVIYIAPGIYKEKLVITSPYVSLVGAGMDATTIVYGDYAGTSATTGQPGHTGNTFYSQTVDVKADFFTASNLTIENSAGPRSKVAQAVALSLKSDMAVFEGVRLKGYQDTLYNGLNAKNEGRHYFHNSIIEGDVDFIFGEAPAVVMDNVTMVLVSHEGGGGHITAGAQKSEDDEGYVFLNSQIVDGASALGTYDLGRPWKDYARVSFINTFINSQKFLSSGWVTACAGTCKTSYFSEYNSYGPGANASARTAAVQLTGAEASVTIPQLFKGWDPTIPVIMPKAQYLPAVYLTSSRFDKNPSMQADLYAVERSNGYVLTGITANGTALDASAVEAAGSGYVIKKAYLAALPEGTVELLFHYGSVTVPVTIQVVDTAQVDLGRQVLAANDGWASYTTGTTGGSSANSDNAFVVTKRSELVKAVSGNTPKIVYVDGTIDMNVDDSDNPVDIGFYTDPGYDFDAYLAAYDPEVWGKNMPSGSLEEARARSQSNQGARIKINVGSNTTIVGLPGSKAKILGGNMNLDKVDNVIIRNIDFQNTFDHFPQWDPTDGDFGNWNSAYDSISVKGSTHVWIDRNTFSDAGGLDDPSHTYYGRKYQQHDGAVDITNAADLVTVSYNYFHDHDKLTLIGGSDQATADSGKLRITLHHNYYQNVGQRAPRVRFGEVHVYNNFYEGTAKHAHNPNLYSIGVGYKSQVYAENNFFAYDAGTQPQALIQVSPGGTTFTDKGSILNWSSVDIAKAYNAGAPGALSPVSWSPALYTQMDKTTDVPAVVIANAGAEGTLVRGPFTPPVSSGGGVSVQPPSKPSSTVTVETGAPVKETLEDGRQLLKVTVTEGAIRKALETIKSASDSSSAVLIIEIPGAEGAAQVELPAPSVAEAVEQDSKAILSVRTTFGSYELPLEAVDLKELTSKLGAQLKDTVITVTIGRVSASTADSIQAAAERIGTAPLASAVEFQVAASFNGKSADISSYGTRYVTRTLIADKAMDSGKATVVRYDPVKDSFSFVPALFSVVDGSLKAEIKHPGNGVYLIVQSGSVSFDDLADHWSKADVELLASKWIVDGTGENRFSPDSPVTRAEFAALLVRSMGLSEKESSIFTDVNGAEWYAGAVGAASEAGIIDGFEDGTFRAQAVITREQMSVMIARALALAGYDGEPGDGALAGFSDKSSISSWAREAAAQAAGAGIINGMEDDSFQPKEQASRAQAAVMLKRWLLAAEFMN
jgi:pectate lyase/pectin methylesterase-like acyl-CoA thioesterase